MMSTYVWFGKSLVVAWLLTLVMTTAVSWESSVDVLAVPAVSAMAGGLLKGDAACAHHGVLLLPLCK
jgi:hypothetical protein